MGVNHEAVLKEVKGLASLQPNWVQQLRMATHRLHNFLLMFAMHDYYYCTLTEASLLQHKDEVAARRRRSLILERSI